MLVSQNILLHFYIRIIWSDGTAYAFVSRNPSCPMGDSAMWHQLLRTPNKKDRWYGLQRPFWYPMYHVQVHSTTVCPSYNTKPPWSLPNTMMLFMIRLNPPHPSPPHPSIHPLIGKKNWHINSYLNLHQPATMSPRVAPPLLAECAKISRTRKALMLRHIGRK